MKLSAHRRRDTFLYCETEKGTKVHLFVPSKDRTKTVCGKEVILEGFTGKLYERELCNTCWHGSGR